MITSSRPVVVVGVTGPGRETAALRFAVEHATRVGAEIVLAHAIHAAPHPPPASALLTYADATDVAAWVLKEVCEELERTTGGRVDFRSVAVAGTPSRVLGDLSDGADLVVLQQSGGHSLRRLFTGSTASGVAARAVCPVVTVNPDWQADDVGGEVVVGVHEGGGPVEVLEAGFAWAARTGASLRVVHAWRLDAAYDDIITERVSDRWREEQKQVLAEAVRGLRERYPGVPVVLEVRHQWPSDVLVDDSRVASMVVVGRHGWRPWAAHYVGSVTRTVLREAKSPVMVVPVDHGARHDRDVVADEVSPQT